MISFQNKVMFLSINILALILKTYKNKSCLHRSGNYWYFPHSVKLLYKDYLIYHLPFLALTGCTWKKKKPSFPFRLCTNILNAIKRAAQQTLLVSPQYKNHIWKKQQSVKQKSNAFVLWVAKNHNTAIQKVLQGHVQASSISMKSHTKYRKYLQLNNQLLRTWVRKQILLNVPTIF